ncbi:unnamed protein product [Effrenium voratum]|uniref:Uncharacterized protein n=1 Tax=Effrenium voratum TaxID=2562239 RepID=A0AA36HNZ6_9DINO|nr:unnamed protein product [Effrenium voratum]
MALAGLSPATRAAQREILSAGKRGDAAGLVRALKCVELGAVSVCTALHRLARRAEWLGDRSFARAEGCAPVLRVASELAPQGTANTLWALARLQLPDQELWATIGAQATKQMPEFEGRHLSNLAWSLAVSSQDDEPLLQLVAHFVARKAEAKELSPQSLANILWSFAFVALWDSEALRAPLAAVRPCAGAFNGRDLSNTLWALCLYKATYPEDWNQLLRSLAKVALAHAASLSPNDLTSILWAFADGTPQLQERRLRGLDQSGRPRTYEALD